MKRKPLVFETLFLKGKEVLPGWVQIEITARNLEPVGARIHAIKVRRRKQSILTYEEAFEEATDPWGQRTTLKSPLPIKRSCSIVREIAPYGTIRNSSKFSSGDTVLLMAYVKGVDQASDIEIEWHWSDGQKR